MPAANKSQRRTIEGDVRIDSQPGRTGGLPGVSGHSRRRRFPGRAAGQQEDGQYDEPGKARKDLIVRAVFSEKSRANYKAKKILHQPGDSLQKQELSSTAGFRQ